MKSETVMISPQTKVAALLAAYPQLESVLIEMAPEFNKLKNPILRKTVAKVATLQQVAKISGLPLADLINQLRLAAGVHETFTDDVDDIADSMEPPEWFTTEGIVDSLDIRPLLDAGEHPMPLVMQRLKQMGASGIFALTASFLPAPLVDAARQQGFAAWSQRTQDGVVTYFTFLQ